MDGISSTDYRLTRFVALPENHIAYHAALRVLGATAGEGVDGEGLLPLFIYGPPGCGKSHLLRGVVTELLERDPETRLSVLQPEEQAAVFPVDSCRPDVVLIEDLHRFRDPDLGERLSDLLQSNSRIVLVSSQSVPRRLTDLGKRLSERLISRLLRGLVVGMAGPGPDSRVRLLSEFAARRQLPLDPATLESLGDVSEQLPASVRRLEALAGALVQAADGSTRAAEILGSLLAEPARASPHHRLAGIVRPVALAFRVHPASLRSARRDRCLLRPRQMAMYLARERTRLPLKRIGQFFGGRDHATVLHACRKIERDAAGDPALAGLLRELRSRVTGC